MMTAAENIPPFLLPKKIKSKKCANFSFWRLWISILSIIVCMFFVKLPPRTAAALSMEKNKTFMAALAVKNKTNPDPRAYLLLKQLLVEMQKLLLLFTKKEKVNKKIKLCKNKRECCL